jgi:hypothetical protein
MSRALVILCLVLFLASPAFAGQPEAREVARLNNCPPKKIEVVQNFPGGQGKTVYRVTCMLPKTTGEAAGASAILIECEQSLCALASPVAAEQK